jgi:hypothetical protein
MTCVERSQQFDNLIAANLTKDQTIRTHAQGIAQQHTHR